MVTRDSRGAGVEELIRSILEDKLPERRRRLIQQELVHKN